MTAGAAAVLIVFVGMSVVALMALPVEKGIPVDGSQSSGYGTELGGKYIENPVLGVVHALTSSWVGDALGYVVAVVASLVLIQAANAGMVGIARTTYTLATHRQIPRGVARLHSRYGTPWIVLAIFSVLAFLLVLPHDIELLAGHVRLRGADRVCDRPPVGLPDARHRARSAACLQGPVQHQVRSLRSCRCRRCSARSVSIAAWVLTFVYHDNARWLGSAWMATRADDLRRSIEPARGCR